MAIEPIATATGGSSLTTGAKATASNVFQKSSRYAPTMAVDGDPETRWATDAGTKQAWLEVDLRYETEISKAVVQEWEGDRGRIRKLEIRVKDGEAWKTVAAADSAAKPLAFPAVKARHVRLEILDAKDGPTVEEFHLQK
jgi:alpha-L-fucosidase